MAKHDHHDWEAAWQAAYPDQPRPAAAPEAHRRRRSPRTRSVLLATGLLVLGVTSVGVAANGDVLREGQRNGTATRETEIVSRTNEAGNAKGGYATRQSNLSNSGGGAIYGCRAGNGTNTNPCLRANNLAGGLAFEFNATRGDLGGTFTVGAGGDAKKPFTTNATGVATGLNADEVDGQSAGEIVAAAAGSPAARTRWVLVDAGGNIEAQSGGFTLKSGYGADPAGAAGNVYIDAGEDLSNNAITATIALQNQVDQDANGNTNGRQPGADQNAEFSGEISATRCAIAGVVTCAPPGTNTSTHFVVSPRLSDGQVTGESNRKRFYVIISE
jgi:hypothetical protein